MSYNFGQYRKDQSEEYITSLDYNYNYEKPNKVMTLTGDNILKPLDENGKQKSYYLDLTVDKLDFPQDIVIKLKNSNDLSIPEQVIKSFSVEVKKEEIDNISFDLVISPKNTYNQIYFELQNALENQQLEIHIGNFAKINDIVVKTGHERLKQIGVQGPTGLLMSINGEEIRIGRSGIYEINYGATVTSFGVALNKDDNRNFLLDYQY